MACRLCASAVARQASDRFVFLVGFGLSVLAESACLRYLLVPSFLRQFGRYASAVAWLFGRAWSRFKGHLLLVLFGQWLGLGVSAISLMLLLALVRRLDSMEPSEPLGITLPLSDDHYLAGVAALILLTMTVGVLLLYRAKRSAVNLSARFTIACAAEVANGYGVLASAAYVNDGKLRNEMARLMGSDARHAAMALRRLIDAKLASLVLLVGTGALFYLSWPATMAVLLAAVSVLPFYYRINQKAARASRRFEMMSGPGRADCLRGLELQQRVNSYEQASFPIDGTGYPAFQAVVEAHRDRFVAITQSELTSRLLMVLAVCILALGLIQYSGEDEIPWVLVLSYLLVLRFVMLAIRQISQAFTSISRFYPSLHRLTQYFLIQDAPSQTIDLDSLALTARRHSLVERRKKLTLRLGRPALVYLPSELSRFNVELLARALGLKTASQQRGLIDSAVLVVGVGEVDSTTVQSVSSPERVGRIAKLTQLPIQQVEFVLGLLQPDDCVLARKGWFDECRARVSLAEAWLTDRSLMLINLEVPGMARAVIAMRECLAERRLLLCGLRKGDLPAGLRISMAAMVGANGTVVALGSVGWMQENWKAISAQRARIEKRLLATQAANGQEESFEEE